LLLDRGAYIEAKLRDGSTTALLQAVFNKHADVVRLLIERGADVNVRDREGDSALSYAVQSHQMEVVRMLKAAGARR